MKSGRFVATDKADQCGSPTHITGADAYRFDCTSFTAGDLVVTARIASTYALSFPCMHVPRISLPLLFLNYIDTAVALLRLAV